MPTCFYTQSDYSDLRPRLSSLSMMGDLIYRVDLGLPVGVYGGAGRRRGARHDRFPPIRRAAAPCSPGRRWGGVDYRFSPETTLFAEYRYQNAHDANVVPLTGVGYTSNNVSVGLKFDM
ncbi:MAG: hypothetical protein WDM81_03485 [Rhizomicrobium sp.]